MKLLRIVMGTAALLGLLAAAEEAPPAHKKLMKDLGGQMGAIRKGVDVEKNAASMQATLQEVAAWWKGRTSDVAMKTCQDSSQGAAQIAKAAQAGDKEGIGAGMKMVGAGCKGCHDVHREKVSETEYRIK